MHACAQRCRLTAASPDTQACMAGWLARIAVHLHLPCSAQQGCRPGLYALTFQQLS